MATPVIANFSPMPDGNFVLNPPLYVENRVLAANTAEDISVPTYLSAGSVATRARIAVINSTANIFVAYKQIGDGSPPTAVVPAADTTDGSGCELNPNIRYVAGIDKLSVISSAACVVSVGFYR